MRCLLIICFFGLTIANAQVAPILLKGKLEMETGELFTYQLELTEHNNILSGFAYTFDKPKDTKATIVGKIDKKRGVMSFQEQDIVYSYSAPTKAFMCVLKSTLERKGAVLTGKCTSSETDHTACTPGVITFTNNDAIQQLFDAHDGYDMTVEMGNRKKVQPTATALDTPISRKPISSVVEQLTTGVQKTYNWESDSVVLELWDGGYFDADAISITFDGKIVLPSYVLQAQHKRMVIPHIGPGKHTLNILAVNDGSDPPNTATCDLTDGNYTYHLLAYNKKGMSCTVSIVKEGAPKK